MKKCPFCAEEIQDEAIVCRFCGRDLARGGEQKSITIHDANVQNINGVTIDLHKVVRARPKLKFAGAALLAQQTKISQKEAQSILYPIYEKYQVELKKVGLTEQFKAEATLKEDQVNAERSKLAEYDRQGIPYCPKCHSTSLTANKKGFGIGKAVVGAAIVGPIGLVAGNVGSQQVRVTCLNCGHQFMAGKK